MCNHHHYPIPGHSITPKRNSILINVFMLSCSVVFDSLDCSPPGSSVHVIFQTRILEWGCHFLLHGIFQTQGSNLCLLHLLHCKQILYHWAIREASILISNHSQFLFPWALVATNLFFASGSAYSGHLMWMELCNMWLFLLPSPNIRLSSFLHVVWISTSFIVVFK